VIVKPRLYLDTSVPSAHFDSRAPERQGLTRQFWLQRLPEFDAAVSTLVLAEIADTPDSERRRNMEELISGFAVLELNAEAEALAEAYVVQGVFAAPDRGDALHVAIASANRIGYLASWNFKHMVRVRTRREVSLVNALRGYDPVEIVAPPEL
jgi:predicted nucleic acid-binding protein